MKHVVRPLQWIGPRTPDAARKRGVFKASWSSTLDLLDTELRALDARNVVLQLDVTDRDIRIDGQIRANAKPGSPAVRLVFDSRHGPLGYGCDRHAAWEHNVRAIALGMQALRAVDRWGIGQGAQYRGYRELTTATDPEHLIRQSAGVGPHMPLDRAWRAARAATHPDRNNGDSTGWNAVEDAARRLGLT